MLLDERFSDFTKLKTRQYGRKEKVHLFMALITATVNAAFLGRLLSLTHS